MKDQLVPLRGSYMLIALALTVGVLLLVLDPPITIARRGNLILNTLEVNVAAAVFWVGLVWGICSLYLHKIRQSRFVYVLGKTSEWIMRILVVTLGILIMMF